MNQDFTEYDDTHKVLLNYIMAVRYIDQSKLLEQFSIILEEYDNDLLPEEENLKKYISTINVKLQSYDFKIDELRHQITGMTNFIFITTKQDEFIKSNTPYSPPELDAVKGIIEEIIENDYHYSIGLVNACQKVSQNLNKSLRESNNFLSTLIDDGWFELTNEDKLILSIRSICELKNYLIDTFGIYKEDDKSGKILTCDVCNQIITLGLKNLNDFKKFHYRCFEIYKRQNVDEKDKEDDYDAIGVSISTLE